MSKSVPRGFALLPTLIFLLIISLWTLHGLEQTEAGFAAASHVHRASVLQRELEQRLRQVELMIASGVAPADDPLVIVEPAGCIEWSGRYQTACPQQNPYASAYRISVHSDTPGVAAALSAVVLATQPLAQALPDLPQIGPNAISFLIISDLDIFSDPSSLPPPGRLATRQAPDF